ALTIREWPLIKRTLQSPARVLSHLAVFGPGDAGDVSHVIETLHEVENQLLPIPTADEVHLGALQLDQRRIQAGEHAAERQPHPGIGGANLPSEDLCIRVAGGAEKAQPD